MQHHKEKYLKITELQREKGGRRGRLFKAIRTENFPNVERGLSIQVHEVHRSPNNLILNSPKDTQSIIKDKAGRKRKLVTYK